MQYRQKRSIILILTLVTLLIFSQIALAASSSKSSKSSSSSLGGKGSSSGQNSMGSNSKADPKGVTVTNRYDKVYATGQMNSSSGNKEVTLKTVTDKNGDTKWIVVGGGGDSGGGSNSSPSATTPDLSVVSVTPNAYRSGTAAMTMVRVQETQGGTAGSVDVKLEISGIGAQTQTVNVPASGYATAVFSWTPSANGGSLMLTATVNPNHTITETSYDNNTMSIAATVRAPYVNAVEQPTPISIPTRPAGENNDYVTWEETVNGVTDSYWARLSLSASPSTSTLKSGYGFGVTVTATVTTNYTGSFAPSQVVMFVPERGYNEVVRLVRDGSTWTLPASPWSMIGAKKWYVPVWFPDDKAYEPIITAVGASTPGGRTYGDRALEHPHSWEHV